MSSRFSAELASAHPPRSAVELRAAGISYSMTRGAAWRRSSRGFYTPTDTAGTLTPAQRILDAAPLVPEGGALGGWSAAYAQGANSLDGLDSWSMRQIPQLICLGQDLGRTAPSGILYSRSPLPMTDITEVEGLTLTTPLRTAFDGARWARNWVEAVVFLDAMAYAKLIDLFQLRRFVEEHAGWRAIGQIRRALDLADVAANGGWESRLRMFYQVEAGLPRPLVNQPVFDPYGNLAGIPDLLDVEAGLASESDGSGHREPEQHRRDNAREEGLEALNLVVTRSDHIDLRQHRVRLRHRLLDGYARGMRRDRSQDRWTLEQPDWFRSRYAS